MKLEYILAGIILSIALLGVWMIRRGFRRLNTKLDANARFSFMNPWTAVRFGPLFPVRFQQIDHAMIMTGVYIIVIMAYALLAMMMREKTLWLLTFGAMVFAGTGLMATAPHKEGRQLGFIFMMIGVLITVSVLLGVFPR